MRSNFFKKLSEQEVYNITDGISITLHEKYLKELGLDWNTLDTDISNEISEIIDDCIEQMHEEMKSRLSDYALCQNQEQGGGKWNKENKIK